jgi:hypothetical protein
MDKNRRRYFQGYQGVSQGNHLGPLCFVNRISVNFDYVHLLFYAYDQSNLNKLSKWCEENSLFLNIDKCKTITS